MKLSAAITTIALALLPAVSADTLAYDPVYDNPNGSLTTVACSNGPNGLMTDGYTTFGSLPNFPYIGAAAAVTGWNSPQCGSCWHLTYAVTGMSINMLAIDSAAVGFVVGLTAMNALTNGQGQFLGRINVTATQIPASQCGM